MLGIGDPTIYRTVLALLLASTSIAFWLIRLAETYEPPIATEFRNLMIGFGLWTASYALMLITDIGTFTYFYWLVNSNALIFASALWFLFVYRHTHTERILSTNEKGLLFSVPILLTTLSITNSWHQLLYTDISLTSVGAGFTAITTVATPFGEVYPLIALIYIIPPFFFLSGSVINGTGYHRTQSFIILLGGLITLSFSAISRVGTQPLPGVRLSPFLFIINGIIAWWVLFEYDFIDGTTIGIQTAVKSMDDGFLLLSGTGEIVDFNSSVQRIFPDIGENVGVELSEAYPRFAKSLNSDTVFVSDSVDENEQQYLYKVSSERITDAYGVERGEAVILSDITLEYTRQQTLETLQQVTQNLMEARSKDEIVRISNNAINGMFDHTFGGLVLYEDDSLVPAGHQEIRKLFSDAAVLETFNDSLLEALIENDCKLSDIADEPLDIDSQESIHPDVAYIEAYPIGDHGCLLYGTRSKDTDYDDQYYQILARMVRNALERTNRMQQLEDQRETIATKKDEVKQRKQQVEFFNGILRHNILNGMTVINGNLKQLDDVVDPEHSEITDTLIDWCDDVTELTQEVRKITRTVTDKTGAELKPVNLTKVLGRRANKLEKLHDNVTITIEFEQDPIYIAGNELLGEVVENLFINSIEHNDTDEVEIDIRVRVVDGNYQVRIADNGPGIEDSRKEDVFHEGISKTNNGTIGFGLYFVKTMVEEFNGEIHFEDNEPAGAVAVINFPTGGEIMDKDQPSKTATPSK